MADSATARLVSMVESGTISWQAAIAEAGAAGVADGRSAMRSDLSAVLSAAFFCNLAGWFDDDDAAKMLLYALDDTLPGIWASREDRLQEDLRRFADLLDGGHDTDSRELLGRLVRDVFADWAREQPDPKPSWLIGWDDLEDGQREVDMRIGTALAAAGRAGARQRIIAWLNGEGRRLQRQVHAADPHGPAARRAVRNLAVLQSSCFNAATLLEELP